MATTDAGDELPREPSAYRASMHFAERFHDRYDDETPPRHLDGEIVDGCIKHGDVVEKDAVTRELHETFGGITYCLVVNTRTMKVVSGYPININTDHARRSGRWSDEQIEDILEFIRTDSR